MSLSIPMHGNTGIAWVHNYTGEKGVVIWDQLGCLDESIPMDHVRGSRDLPYIATSKVHA